MKKKNLVSNTGGLTDTKNVDSFIKEIKTIYTQR